MTPSPDTIPKDFLKSLRPETFNGLHRDHCAENWFDRYERYCDAAEIPETGQARIRCAGLLFTDSASVWYKRLGMIGPATVNNQNLSAYDVFKLKFRQCFIDVNDAENAFDQIRYLSQKRSMNEYVTIFEKYRSRLPKLTDADAVLFFHGGLKPELRQLMDNHPEIANNDIDGLIVLAERLDKMNKNEHQFNRSY
ncbi:hypothetical protein BGZ81_004740, partial [Podila clonocystis]